MARIATAEELRKAALQRAATEKQRQDAAAAQGAAAPATYEDYVRQQMQARTGTAAPAQQQQANPFALTEDAIRMSQALLDSVKKVHPTTYTPYAGGGVRGMGLDLYNASAPATQRAMQGMSMQGYMPTNEQLKQLLSGEAYKPDISGWEYFTNDAEARRSVERSVGDSRAILDAASAEGYFDMPENLTPESIHLTSDKYLQGMQYDTKFDNLDYLDNLRNLARTASDSKGNRQWAAGHTFTNNNGDTVWGAGWASRFSKGVYDLYESEREYYDETGEINGWSGLMEAYLDYDAMVHDGEDWTNEDSIIQNALILNHIISGGSIENYNPDEAAEWFDSLEMEDQDFMLEWALGAFANRELGYETVNWGNQNPGINNPLSELGGVYAGFDLLQLRRVTATEERTGEADNEASRAMDAKADRDLIAKEIENREEYASAVSELDSEILEKGYTITPEQLEEARQEVNERYAEFLDNTGYGNLMLPAELVRYKYLMDTDPTGAEADAYIELLKDEKLLQARYLANSAETAVYANDPLFAVPTAVGSVAAGVVDIPMAVGKFVESVGGDANPYSRWHDMSHYKGNVRIAQREGIAEGVKDGTDSELLAGAAGMGYDVLMGAGDMLPALAVTAITKNPKAGAAFMGAQSYSQGMTEAALRGYDPVLTQGYALGTAAIEALTEKYSIETLLKDPTTVLGTVARNFVAEGSEELASGALNMALDTVANEIAGNENEFEALYRQLKDEGRENAYAEALAQTVGDLVYQGAVGGFTGGLMSAPGAVLNSMRNYTLGTRIKEGGNALPLMQMGTQMEAGSESQTLADEMMRKYKAFYDQQQAQAAAGEAETQTKVETPRAQVEEIQAAARESVAEQTAETAQAKVETPRAQVEEIQAAARESEAEQTAETAQAKVETPRAQVEEIQAEARESEPVQAAEVKQAQVETPRAQVEEIQTAARESEAEKAAPVEEKQPKAKQPKGKRPKEASSIKIGRLYRTMMAEAQSQHQSELTQRGVKAVEEAIGEKYRKLQLPESERYKPHAIARAIVDFGNDGQIKAYQQRNGEVVYDLTPEAKKTKAGRFIATHRVTMEIVNEYGSGNAEWAVDLTFDNMVNKTRGAEQVEKLQALLPPSRREKARQAAEEKRREEREAAAKAGTQTVDDIEEATRAGVDTLTGRENAKEVASRTITYKKGDKPQVVGELVRVERTAGGDIQAVVRNAEGEVEVSRDELVRVGGTGVARVMDYASNRQEITTEEINEMIDLIEGNTNKQVTSSTIIAAYTAGVGAGFVSGEEPSTDLFVPGASQEIKAFVQKVIDKGAAMGANEATAEEAGRQVRDDEAKVNNGGGVFYMGKVPNELGRLLDNGIRQGVATLKQRGQETLNAMVDVVGKIAQVTGVDVVFFEADAAEGDEILTSNGAFDPNTRTIFLDVNAGLQRAGETLNFAALKSFAHELTHYIEKYAGKAYADLRSLIRDTVGKQGESYLQLINNKLREDPSLDSRAKAEAEVIADATELMLNNTQAIEELAQKNPSLATRVAAFVRSVVDKIKAAFASIVSGTRESALLTEMKDGVTRYLDGIQEAWDKALVEAANRAQGINEATGVSQSEAQETVEQEAVADEAADAQEAVETVEDAEAVAEEAVEAVEDAEQVGAEQTTEEEAQAASQPVITQEQVNEALQGVEIDMDEGQQLAAAQEIVEAATEAVVENAEVIDAAMGIVVQDAADGSTQVAHVQTGVRPGEVVYQTMENAETTALKAAQTAAQNVAERYYRGERADWRQGLGMIARNAAQQAVDRYMWQRTVEGARARLVQNAAETGASVQAIGGEAAGSVTPAEGTVRPSVYRDGNRDGTYAGSETDSDIVYSKRRYVPNMRNVLGKMQVTEDMTETERKLLEKYKADMVQLEKLSEKIREQEEIINSEATADEKTKARNTIKTLDQQRARVNGRLLRAERADGFARIMSQSRTMVRLFLKSDSRQDAAEKVAEELKGINTELDALVEEMDKTNEAEMARMLRSLFDQKALDNAARELKQAFGSRMTLKELQNRIIILQSMMMGGGTNAGQNAMEILEQLTRDLINSGVRSESQTLEILREYIGTIHVTEAQWAELKARGITRAEFRNVVGKVVRVATGVGPDLGSYIENDNYDGSEGHGLQALFEGYENEGDAIVRLYELIKDEKSKIGENMFEGRYGKELLQEAQIEVLDISSRAVTDRASADTFASVLDALTEQGEQYETVRTKANELRQKVKVTAGRAGGVARNSYVRQEALEVAEYYRKLEKQRALTEIREERQLIRDELSGEFRTQMDAWYAEKERQESNRAMLNNIRRLVGWMDKRIRNETKQKRIPEGLKPVVEEMVRIFSEANNVMHIFPMREINDIRKVYGALSKIDGSDLHQVDGLIEGNMEDALRNIRETVNAYGKKGEIRSRAERDQARTEVLTNMRDAVAMVWKAVNDVDSLLVSGQKVELSAMADSLAAQLKGLKDYSYGDNIGGKSMEAIKKLLRNGNLTPVYFFRLLGLDVMTQLNDSMLYGQEKEAFNHDKAARKINELQEKHNYWKWRNNAPLEFTTEQGKKNKTGLHDIRLTVGEAMGIWATWQREMTTVDLYESTHLAKGGFVLQSGTRIKDGKVVSDETPHKLTEGDLRVIDEYLTPEMKAYARDFVEYMSTDMADQGNAVSMRMLGIKLFKEAFYYPMRVDGDYLETSFARDVEGDATANRQANKGFTKRRVRYAKKPLIIGDFTRVAGNHVNDMVMYSSFAEALEAFNKLLNYKLVEPDSMDESTESAMTIKSLLKQKIGGDLYNYLVRYLRDVNGGMNNNDDRGLNKMVSLFNKAAVAANMSVVFKQPMSIFRAMLYVNPKYFIPLLNHKDKVSITKEWNQLKQYSGVALIKERGGFDMTSRMTDLGDDAENVYGTFKLIRDAAKDSGSKVENKARRKQAAQSAWRRFENVISAGAAKADQITWAYMWRAIKAETAAANTGMDTSSDEFLELAADRFNEVMNLTQVYNSTLVRSQSMRNKSFGWRAVTSFAAEPTLTANILMDAMNKKSFKAVGGALAVFLVSQVATAMAGALGKAGRSDDEEKPWLEKYLNAAENELFGWSGSLNMLNLFPILRDLMTMLDGYDVERPDMSLVGEGITQLQRGIELLKKAANGEYEGNAWKDIEETAGALANLAGVPLKNIMRELRAAYNTVMGIAKPPRKTDGRVVAHDLLSNMDMSKHIPLIDTSWDAYYTKLYEAMRKGDKDEVESLREFLTIEGKSETSINTGVKNALKYAVKQDEITEEEAKKLLIDYGISKDEKAAFRVVDGWAEKEQHKGEEDYSYGVYDTLHESIADYDAKAVEAEIKVLTANGWTDKEVRQELRSHVYEEYRKGDVTRSEAERILKKHGGYKAEEVSDPDFWYWTFREQDVKKTDPDEDFSRYDALYGALDKGSDAGVKAAVKELTAHGYTQQEAESKAYSHLFEQYRKGKMTWTQAQTMAKKHAGKGDLDANDWYWEQRKQDWGKANGGSTDGYAKYADYYKAVETGVNIKTVTQEYLTHGIEAQELAANITKQYKEEYIRLYKTNKTAAANLQNRLLNAYTLLGYDRSKKIKDIAKWLE